MPASRAPRVCSRSSTSCVSRATSTSSGTSSCWRRLPALPDSVRVHLVDGTYELFRFFYSKRPPHKDPQGRDRKAVAGVTSSMLQLLNDPKEDVTHIAIAFDNPIESFRNDLFDGYKTSAGVQPELLDQFDPVEEAMHALGITVWSMDRWECDDALATGAHRFADAAEQVRI